MEMAAFNTLPPFIARLRELGIPPGATVKVTGLGVRSVADWPASAGRSARLAADRAAAERAAAERAAAERKRLAAKQAAERSARLEKERKRLEAENALLREQIAEGERVKLALGNPIARFAAGIKIKAKPKAK